MTRSARRALVGFVVLVGVAAGAIAASEGAVVRDSAPSTTAARPMIDLPPVMDATPSGPPRVLDNRLFVVGDSVMQGAAPELVDLLDEWSVETDTRVGRFLDEGIRVTRRRAGRLGDVVIVGLGNNYGGDEAAFAREVDEMLDVLDGVELILWVTVAEFRPDRREVNDVLRAAAADDERVVLVDWVPVWRRHEQLTSTDRLHLTGEGAEAMAELIDVTLRRALRTANAVPAPNPAAPKVNQSGSIPADTGRRPRPSPTAEDPATTTVDHDRDSPATSPSAESTTSSPVPSTSPPATEPATSAPATAPPATEPPPTAPGPTAPPGS